MITIFGCILILLGGLITLVTGFGLLYPSQFNIADSYSKRIISRTMAVGIALSIIGGLMI